MYSQPSNTTVTMECGRPTTHYLSELSPAEMDTLQKLSIKRLKGLNLGNISIPKQSLKSAANVRRMSLRRNAAVSQVFGLPLHKVACAPIDPTLLEQPIKLRDWLLSERQPITQQDSLTDSDSPPPFVRSAPLRRSCPNRSRPRHNLESSLSTQDLQADQSATHSDRTAWLPCIVLEAARHISQCGLRTEGVFRKSGSHVRMRQLREQWETGALPALPWRQGHFRFSYELHRPHDIVGLLKEVLRELPTPLIPLELRPAFIRLSGSQPISWLLILLPVRHRHLLQLVLSLCQLVLLHSSHNKMDALSLATVLAPGILPDPANEREDTLASVAVVRHLIDNFSNLFTVSSADFQMAQTVSRLQLTDSIPGVKRETVASRLCDSVRLELPPLPPRHIVSPLTTSCRSSGRNTPDLAHFKQELRFSKPELNRESPDLFRLEFGRQSPEPLGQRVKKFFRRALHSPVDSPATPAKFQTCRSLSAHSHESLNQRPRGHSQRRAASPQPVKPRANSGAIPSENALRPKQQFVIRPIRTQDSYPIPDVGPAPRILSEREVPPGNARAFYASQGSNLIVQSQLKRRLLSNNSNHTLAPSQKQLA